MNDLIDTAGLFVLDVLNHPECAALSFAAAVACVLLALALFSDNEHE